MSSGSSNNSILNMPSYGEGLAEALAAQQDALSGALTGRSLQSVVEQYERPLRMSAAQIDNDVLRQTLLGGQVPVYESAQGKDIVQRRVFQPGEGGQTTQIDYGGQIIKTGPDAGKVIIRDGEVNPSIKELQEIMARYNETGQWAQEMEDWAVRADLSGIDAEEALELIRQNDINGGAGLSLSEINENTGTNPDGSKPDPLAVGLFYSMMRDYGTMGRRGAGADAFLKNYGRPEPVYKTNNDIQGADSAYEQYKKDGGNLSREEWGKSDFFVPKDDEGNFILEASSETEIPTGGFASPDGQLTGYTRAGTGLVDMLGDTRNVQEYTTRKATQADVNAGLADEVGQTITVPSGTRQAGFSEDKKFLGLSALAEDIQRGNLSRQREADLADVERLSDRYSDVMDQFRPGTQQALTDASAVLEAQKDNLTGAGALTVPGTSTYAGDITAGTMTGATVGDTPTLTAKTGYTPSTSVTGGTFDAGTSYTAQGVADPLALTAATSYDPSAGVTGETYTAAQAGDPMELTAATSYDPSASVSGDGYTATAGLEGGNVGADALRKALLADAETALGQGLTDRELANISNAARARQTMMGRTFDQSGSIAEAQALVAEDNARRMQNRAFAGDTLGRESDIQRSDLERGLQANIRNQDALNRASEFTASQNMQAQLANQAATNQALQAGMTAGLSQEALAAQQKQAQEFANQAASNRALEFGASSSMDAQRLNQAATNQALSQGLSAGLSQEALAAQQAQTKAMADASAVNQAAQFGVSAGMNQQAQANQAALQAQLANQQASNQAAQFGVGASMEQDALRAQLGQDRNFTQAGFDQQAAAFDADAAQRASQINQAQAQQAAQFGVGATMDAQRLNEQLKQAGTLGYIDASTRLAALEDQYALDPFAAILGRASGGSLQAGQGVFGQAGYGLNSAPQYLNPESGLGYISQMAANDANMYAAQLSADATRDAGMMNMIGSIAGAGVGAATKFCWVAREVYGPTNPAWLQFREWMFTESPNWFFNLYKNYGERFAQWISDKPRIKSIIRKWMDSKIGGK